MRLIEKLQHAHLGNYNNIQEISDVIELARDFGGNPNDLYQISIQYYITGLSRDALECLYGLPGSQIDDMISRATHRILIADAYFRAGKAYQDIVEECFIASLENEEDEYVF